MRVSFNISAPNCIIPVHTGKKELASWENDNLQKKGVVTSQDVAQWLENGTKGTYVPTKWRGGIGQPATVLGAVSN